MLYVLEDTIIDTIKLVPFLFLTYLAMEYLEHKASGKMENAVRKAGRGGPFWGSLAGVVPQCGFSAAASGLYAGRVISLGSLLAIYLSTSDEMLPILLSEQADWKLIAGILLWKIAIGMTAGFAADFVLRIRKDHGGLFGRERNPRQESPADQAHHCSHIHDLCEKEHCQCEKGILRSAVTHTLQITLFVLLITFVLNLVLHLGGEEVLADLLLNRPVAGPLIAGAVGLIPNCVGSIVVTQLYLEGAMGFGTMMAGLLTSTGVGVLILCRVNHNCRENAMIIGLVYGIGVVMGILL